MKRLVLAVLLSWAAVPASAQDADIGAIVDRHILPGFRALDAATTNMADTAQADCSADSPALRGAWADAFDAWIGVSHLRFGPSEDQDRAFALAFWPDTRGFTPKTLGQLIRDADPVVRDPAEFRHVSIAALGFYALEYLLFDPAFVDMGTPEYRCALIRAVSADAAGLAADILAGWEEEHADLLRGAGTNDAYRTRDEAARQLYTALTTGLQFTSDTRLGRPMGTFDRPRPNRAEARRSGRSLRHVILSLEALRELAALLSDGDAVIDAGFAEALERAGDLDDPVLAGVTTPSGRFRVELVKDSIDSLRRVIGERLAPKLGVEAGFNAMDGD